MSDQGRAVFIRSRVRRFLCALTLCGPYYEHVGSNVYRCRLCGGLSNGEMEDRRNA